MSAPRVIGALRRFLPAFLREHPAQDRARRRAIWAITHCRTPAMGGHLHACQKCGTAHFAYHSCNHRACPQCGKEATAQWVEAELRKRIAAPCFMVTFTLPEELRALFFTSAARQVYDLFLAAASQALAQTLVNPRWLGAARNGFTLILHTWNQRLLFHPHIHAIVPGAGLDAAGRFVRVKSPGFLVPQPVLQAAFRRLFREKLQALRQLPQGRLLPPTHPAVWTKHWGVHLQGFGDGANIIKYLGAYVCRTAIGDSRIKKVSSSTVTFSWTDRARGNARRTETISGVQFVARYLRHVLPVGLRSIRRYGFCHPAARDTRLAIAFHSGMPLILAPTDPPPPKPSSPLRCPCCGGPMVPRLRIPPAWNLQRAPPIGQAA